MAESAKGSSGGAARRGPSVVSPWAKHWSHPGWERQVGPTGLHRGLQAGNRAGWHASQEPRAAREGERRSGIARRMTAWRQAEKTDSMSFPNGPRVGKSRGM